MRPPRPDRVARDLKRTLRVRRWAGLAAASSLVLWTATGAAAESGVAAEPSAPVSVPARDTNIPSGTTLPVAGKPVALGLPRRHEGTELAWDPAFNRMDLPEMIITGSAAGVALATAIVPPLKTGWSGGILFDDSVRNALRPASFQARLDARDASDVGLGLITTFPIVVDALIVAYWYRGSNDVALQMGLIDVEALTIAGALQGTANFFAGRERPYGPGCGTAIPSDIVDCQSSSRYRSFFSGHSTLSFTSASLICSHHLALHLFESPADPVTCASGYLAAATIATLRIVGDEHYATDVLTGALVGTAVGLGIPLLHHYRRQPVLHTASGGVDVQLVPSPSGAVVMGTF